VKEVQRANKVLVDFRVLLVIVEQREIRGIKERRVILVNKVFPEFKVLRENAERKASKENWVM
jgi:hypothetical protein